MTSLDIKIVKNATDDMWLRNVTYFDIDKASLLNAAWLMYIQGFKKGLARLKPARQKKASSNIEYEN